jgi:CCR4-NOT transcription complex subunit 3
MEKFKAVEKAMKTKAYSKEGLSAAAKLDPKEQAKLEAGEFLSSMVDELEQQIEALEAEGESIQATMKKGKGHSAKAERIAEIERIIERHKWHQGKLELIRRSLENGGVDTDQVTDLEESIRYYVSDGMNDDFMEDECMYDDLSLREEEDAYGMTGDNDKLSSQDTQSVQDDVPDVGPTIPAPKARPAAEATGPSGGRRPSTQMKSPLPTLATMHNPLANLNNGAAGAQAMKPASLPTRPAGEGLKYASAAAAAAERNSLGIAPLPPPPGSAPAPGYNASPALAAAQLRASTTTSSPSTTAIQMATQGGAPLQMDKSSTSALATAGTASNTAPAPHGHIGRPETSKAGPSRGKAPVQAPVSDPAESSKCMFTQCVTPYATTISTTLFC